MEIRQLRHFIAVVEAGNLRKASEQICITPPALSMSLKNLETSIGVKLLERDRKGITLTFAGEKLLPAAQALLNQVNDVKKSLLGCEESPVGNVRIGLPVGLINALSAPLSRLLKTHYPGINLVVEEGNTTTLERSFDDNLIDIMVNYDISDCIDRTVEPMYVEQLYFVGAYEDTNEEDNTICFSELSNYTLISSPGSHSMRRTLDRYAFENNVNFNFIMDFQSAHSSLKLAVEGIAHTIASWDLIHDHVKGKLVIAKRIISPSLERTVCLVSSHRAVNRSAVEAVRTTLKWAIEVAISEDKIRPRA